MSDQEPSYPEAACRGVRDEIARVEAELGRIEQAAVERLRSMGVAVEWQPQEDEGLLTLKALGGDRLQVRTPPAYADSGDRGPEAAQTSPLRTSIDNLVEVRPPLLETVEGFVEIETTDIEVGDAWLVQCSRPLTVTEDLNVQLLSLVGDVRERVAAVDAEVSALNAHTAGELSSPASMPWGAAEGLAGLMTALLDLGRLDVLLRAPEMVPAMGDLVRSVAARLSRASRKQAPVHDRGLILAAAEALLRRGVTPTTRTEFVTLVVGQLAGRQRSRKSRRTRSPSDSTVRRAFAEATDRTSPALSCWDRLSPRN